MNDPSWIVSLREALLEFQALYPQKKTTIVRIQKKGGVVVSDCDLYIGRRCTMGGWNLKESKWHNPFKGADAVEKFRDYILSSPLMNDLHELKGKRLGCWCKPKPCHGDVLVELANRI